MRTDVNERQGDEVNQRDIISSQKLNIAPTQSTVLLVTLLLDLKRPTYLDKNFVQLHHRNGLSQTFEAPVSKDELVVTFHFLQLGPGGFEPALGPDSVGVWAEDDSANNECSGEMIGSMMIYLRGIHGYNTHGSTKTG